MARELLGFDKKTGRPEISLIKEEDSTIILGIFGDSPTARVWQFLWEGRGLDYSFSHIASGARISRNSLYKIWPFFKEREIIIPTKYEKGTQLYRINERSHLANSVISMINTFMRYEVTVSVAQEDAMDKFAVEEKKRKSKKRK